MKKYIMIVLLSLITACATGNHQETPPTTDTEISQNEPEYSSNIFIRRYQQMLDAHRQSTGQEPNFTYKVGTFIPSVLMTAILYPFALAKSSTEDETE